MERAAPRRRVLRAVAYAAAGLALLIVLQARGADPPRGGGGGTTVVVASRALDAGHLVTPDDVSEVAVERAAGLDTLVAHPADAVGRRALVRIPSGSPLSAAELGAPPGPPGWRRVTVLVDRRGLPADTVSGTEVDVVAAVDGGQPADHPPRIEVVARARLVEVNTDQASGQAAAPARSATPAPPSSAGAVAVVLECESASVLRIVWAATYGHSITLLEATGPQPAPPPADGPVATAAPRS